METEQQDQQDIVLNDEIIKNLKSAKIFKDHQKEINSMDFSSDGKKLVTCDDISLNLYDVEHGRKTKTLFLKSKEIECVKFTHHNEAVLCATKKDHQILYWSLHENQIIKQFTGHTDSIVSLEINPVNDQFLTTSKDQSLRLWNLESKTPSCESKLDLSSKNSNFDSCGLIFAVAYQETIAGTSFSKVALYDLKNYDTGCFTDWKFECSEIKQIKFSNSGKYIVCACAENYIMVLDAYQGNEITTIKDFVNDNSILEVSFSPCSTYIVSGSENGIVHIWKTETGESVNQLKNQHFLKCQVVKFNPKFCILATGCKNIILWIPNSYGEQ
ncbi:WD40-repeat-containing domain [Pseudocohnilembus persalinus]|uniref:WD40-repeat-containing domain n=1 Tax=Pseudocohnilembus persalinus TaxID=266149 RepID=A0A0V0QZR8_PSEPJ|nr:WD40-repeat-containing domain [Pseudocohnilembus persalinus]|eukprot:KRX07764.1 WD40-repeat-containing domain [Pseudocohnilembus persalinus]